MAARIPVQVHIGVTPLTIQPDRRDYGSTRVTITEEASGDLQEAFITSGGAPEVDGGGNLAYTVAFDDVQSGGGLHVEVQALDDTGAPLGLLVTHEAQLAEVPDDPARTYYAPQSIYVTAG